MTTERSLREAICEVGRRMYARNLVAATDGNISVRLEPDRFLCTPSGVSKGFMSPDDIVVANAQGEKIVGRGKVTTEFFTHLAAYEQRPDIGAVVHGHPPIVTGLTLAGLGMEQVFLPEVGYALGPIPTADYATPGTKEGAGVIREWIGKCDALLLDRHGAICVGKDVFDALFKLEKVEHAAEAFVVARSLGTVRLMQPEELARLRPVREEYGVTGRALDEGE
ncbi:MAG: class II aldolase/adducin family protein [Candidatus Hydrogenedentes bacterium]|nr:class II aldolase/adducin family protein [Candidatus Hydrogenedentota bacterium]